MFKIAKYKELNGVKTDISLVDATFNNKPFKALGFFIEGKMGNDVFSFSFDTNKPLEFLDLESFGAGYWIDFNKSVQAGDEIFGYNGSFDLDLKADYKILRLNNNNFEYMLTINFISNDTISGIIETEIDFGKYMDTKKLEID